MPNAPLPVAEGGRPGGGGGGQHWLAIGAIAGVGTLAFLMFKGGGSSTDGKTTAAGTSINAALGSIQEQNLNLMGQLGAGVNQLSTQADAYNQSQLAAMSGMQDALSSQMSDVNQNVTDSTSTLMGELNTVDGHVLTNGQNAYQYYANLYNLQNYWGGQGYQWYANLYNQANAGQQSAYNYFNSLYAQAGNNTNYLAGQAQGNTSTLYNYFGNLIAGLQAQIQSLKDSAASAVSSSGGGGGGGGGQVHQYIVNLPGGGQKTVNASSPSAAIGNAGGGTIASQIH